MMSILRVTSVSGNSAIRAALSNATFILECIGHGNSRAEVCLSLSDLKAVVRETRDGQRWREQCMRLEGEAQIRYGMGSEQCGQTPVLLLQEAFRLLAADPCIFKVIFTLEDRQGQEAQLTLREVGSTWILYGYQVEGGNYFQVIPGMPTLAEVGRLD